MCIFPSVTGAVYFLIDDSMTTWFLRLQQPFLTDAMNNMQVTF